MPSLKEKIPARHWLMVAITVFLFLIVAVFVDLKPRVGSNFFFSSNDKAFKEDAKIDRLFPSGSQLIVSVAAPDIASNRYLDKLARLTDELEAIPKVTSAQSLTNGPKNFQDAEKSPFWRRLLIADDRKSSNIVVFASNSGGEQMVKRMEAIVNKFDAPGFRIQIAGAPYVAEMIRRNLSHDFRVFTITCALFFGVAMFWLLRSFKLTLGMFCTCLSAVLCTLIVQSIFGEKIGILTANLSTIVFVVALSHLVYMTFNWQELAGADKDSHNLGGKAWRMTLPASFWSMVCATLGFGSLLLVPAKPLRELGVGGCIGTIIALVCAYLMYPAFLDWATPKETKAVSEESMKSPFWKKKFFIPAVAIVAASFALSVGIFKLDTDPSLLDYFKKGEQPREGLSYIDRNGGVNPLTMVVSAADGGRLDNKEEYNRMWELQDALQDHKGVGTVLSLPVLMAEGKRHAFSFLLTWNKMLEIMNEPKHSRVASTFITKDRKMAAFYLRMDEHGRTIPRVQVVAQLKAIVHKYGFRTDLTGGVYELQGQLAQLVRSSLFSGLFWLMIFFSVIAFIVGRSLQITAAMIFSLCLVPLCMLGGIGVLKVPVDIISAPATNVCIGMAIDSMVHLVFAVRRAQKNGEKGWDAWVSGRREQWRGIVYSDVIIAAGFGIFALSNFPPTQRFGLVVVAGTVVDILANLFLLPLLGGAPLKKGDWKPAQQS